MKKLFIIFLMFAAIGSYAQEEKSQEDNFYYIIPRAGVTFSNLYGDAIDSEWRTGYLVGVDFDADLNGPFGFRTGVHLTSIGGKVAMIEKRYESGSYKPVEVLQPRHNWVMNYITVPLQGEWHPFRNFSVMAGFQFGFRLNFERSDNPADDAYGRNSNVCWVSIPLGLSYDFGKIMLDAHYHLGLSVLSGNSGGQRLDALIVSLGYKINGGRFKNKKPESKFHLPEIGH